MSEKRKSGRSRFGFRELSFSTIVMTKALVFISLIGVWHAAAAATSPESQPPADKTKLAKICKVDIQRFCDEANLKQECLVAHWDKISAECRGVLGSSAGNRANDGS